MAQEDIAGSRAIGMLFDLQKFMLNKRMQTLTEEVGIKYGFVREDSNELADEELEVWAAGDITVGQQGIIHPREVDKDE